MFDNSDDDEPVHLETTVSENAGASSSGQALLFRPAPSCIQRRTPVEWLILSEDKRNILLYLYRQRVDCLYKILHWPTVLADIARLQTEAQDRHKLTAVGALELSICFTSLCSITDDEARNLGLGGRAGLIEQYRDATETALSEAGLLQQPNVTLLQAFVIYLVGFSHLALSCCGCSSNLKRKGWSSNVLQLSNMVDSVGRGS